PGSRPHRPGRGWPGQGLAMMTVVHPPTPAVAVLVTAIHVLLSLFVLSRKGDSRRIDRQGSRGSLGLSRRQDERTCSCGFGVPAAPIAASGKEQALLRCLAKVLQPSLQKSPLRLLLRQGEGPFVGGARLG